MTDHIECPICRQSFKLKIHCADCEAKDKEIDARDAEIEALRERAKDLESEIAAAMKVLNPNMPESGIEDAARQVMQVLVTTQGNQETAEKRVRVLEESLKSVADLESTNAPQYGNGDFWIGLRTGHREAVKIATAALEAEKEVKDAK